MSITLDFICVKWKSRIAGFDRTFVDDIVQKACIHFRLCSHHDAYVLLGDVDGSELELTDDTLKYLLPNRATVTLSDRVPHVCHSDGDSKQRVKQDAKPVSVSSKPQVSASSLVERTGSTRRIESSTSGLVYAQFCPGSDGPLRSHPGGSGDVNTSRDSRQKTPGPPHRLASATNPPPEREITVFVKSPAGKVFVMYLEARDTVDVLRDRVYLECGISPENQQLFCARRQLEHEDRTLVHYGIRDESIIDCIFRGPVTPPEGKITVFAKTSARLTGKTITVHVEAGDTIDTLKDKVYSQDGEPPTYNRLIFCGKTLESGCTLGDYRIFHGAVVHLVQRLRGDKPVIYLFPPEALPSAIVSVCLVPQWSFSHVYPLSQVETLESGKERITWSVSADVDGTLVEKYTGLELSYLFWEALSNGDATPSRPPVSPEPEAQDMVEHFDPSCPSLEPISPTAVLLPFTELLPYLDRVLQSLTLHTSARNDFITYWLPALSKQPYVALRFLPQASYERAAELEVSPAPDVVTRVFMLFRGVAAEDAESDIWKPARDRAGEVDWPSVVGVQADALDKDRFRVLEWGGMEVL